VQQRLVTTGSRIALGFVHTRTLRVDAACASLPVMVTGVPAVPLLKILHRYSLQP
jgi:hypothetical protein